MQYNIGERILVISRSHLISQRNISQYGAVNSLNNNLTTYNIVKLEKA